MTRFRFRYEQAGFIRRRRYRAARGRMELRAWPRTVDNRYAPNMAVWRRIPPVAPPPTPLSSTLQVGSFVVGEESDPQLTGHPDIRY